MSCGWGHTLALGGAYPLITAWISASIDINYCLPLGRFLSALTGHATPEEWV